LSDGLKALHDCLEGWQLVARELGIFTRSESALSGGDG